MAMEGNVMNEIKLEFEAVSENEALARVVAAAFIAGLNVTVDELEDVKTAVSEAVTNAIIHGYKECGGKVIMNAALKRESKDTCLLSVENERSGMGFSFMEAFMDQVTVTSSLNMGTMVHMEKRLKGYDERQ